MTVEEMKRKILSDRELILTNTFKEREFQYKEIPGMATVIVGARRIGKTSFMKQHASTLIKNGLSLEKICYLSFFTSADLDFPFSLIEDAYYGLYPEYQNDPSVWFFLDEVLGIKNWGGGIAHLMEAHPCHVMLTGSSAKMLSTDIADELRGRSIPFRFHPLSFHEFLYFNGVPHERREVYSDSERNIISKEFEKYMRRSSYPQLYNNDDEGLKKLILNTYFDLTFSRDLIDRYDISRSAMLRYLMRRIIKNSGSPYTIRRLVNTLSSAGYPTSIALVSTYIEMMCDSCFLTEISIWGTEKEKERNPRKLYTIDHQMGVLFREFGTSTGIILEHIVLETIKRYSEFKINYYRSREDLETDFVLSDEDGTVYHLIQVTDDYENAEERELRGLLTAMKELKVTRGLIVTGTEIEKQINTENGTVYILPAWKFALNAPLILK